MKKNIISRLRLLSQSIKNPGYDSAKEIVSRMGAMQAQDFNMAILAVGIRVPGTTEAEIEAALNNGEIIRTHLLRPTWHFASPEDIYWMLELTAPHIKASMKFRDRELGLDNEVYKKSNSIIEKAFKRDKNLSRQDLVVEFGKANIDTGNNRASHLLLRAELDKIICSGGKKDKKQTYALLEERVPEKKNLKKEEALALLAQKYFSSRCPATLHDFAWWSGLTISDSKRALESLKSKFIFESIGGDEYIINAEADFSEKNDGEVYLLPAFDEFIISYKDRSVYMTFDEHSKTVSNNGIFRPVIVINGKVSGVWKRTYNGNIVIFETEFFRKHTKHEIKKLYEAFDRLGDFMNKIVEYPKNLI